MKFGLRPAAAVAALMDEAKADDFTAASISDAVWCATSCDRQCLGIAESLLRHGLGPNYVKLAHHRLQFVNRNHYSNYSLLQRLSFVLPTDDLWPTLTLVWPSSWSKMITPCTPFRLMISAPPVTSGLSFSLVKLSY